MRVAHRVRYILFTLTWIPLITTTASTWAGPGCVDADGDGAFKYHHKWCTDGTDLDDNDPCVTDGIEDPCSSGGGGGGDTTLTAQNTEAWWTGDLDSTYRACDTHYLNLANGTVNNECGHGSAYPQVELKFYSTDTDFVTSGRYPELCDMLSQELIFGPEVTDQTNRVSAFIFSSGPEWNGEACDGRVTSTCRIWVRNTAYGELCTQAERDADKCGDRLIIMTGFGDADAAPVVEGIAELNPFTLQQAVSLNELTFDIKGIGKNRTDATCTAKITGASPPVKVTFHTRPVP